jgi:hypothetical protein
MGAAYWSGGQVTNSGARSERIRILRVVRE